VEAAGDDDAIPIKNGKRGTTLPLFFKASISKKMKMKMMIDDD